MESHAPVVLENSSMLLYGFSNILNVIFPISLLLFSPLSPFPKEPPFPIAPQDRLFGEQ